MEWIDDIAVRKGHGPIQFRIAAFLMGKFRKGLTYKEVFLLVYGLNKRKHGESEAKKIAAKAITELHEKHKKENKIIENPESN